MAGRVGQLVIARNPDPESSLGYLLWLPLGEGLLFHTSGTWPRTTALYCHPVELDEWPADAELEVVERVALRSCARRDRSRRVGGAAGAVPVGSG